jgi:4-amino-4-deoxy-L-arabinose transferase-like glycosyltransferase
VAGVTLLNLPSLDRLHTTSHDAKSGLIVRQMVDDGRWFVADVDVGYVNKPPLFYWMGAGVSRLTGGVSEWAVRLPSVLACALAAGLAFALGRELWGRRAGLASAAVLATTVHFHLLAQATRLDSLVMPAMLAAVFFYWRALVAPEAKIVPGTIFFARAGWRWSLAGHAAIAAGVLVKGPIVILLTGLVMIGVIVARRVAREGRIGNDLLRLHLVLGAVVVLAAALPVYLAMDRASGGRFLSYFVLHENLSRAGVAIEDVGGFGGRHVYPFYYYALTIWLGAAPWSIFLPIGVVAAWRSSGQRDGASRTARLVPMLYVALPFVFLSAVSYKKWPYLMPLYPGLALLCGKAWADAVAGTLRDDRWARWTLRAGAVLVAVAFVGTVALMAGALDENVLGRIAGPRGLIPLRRPMQLPEEIDAVRGRALGGAVPLALASAALAATAALLWRRKVARVMPAVLVLAVAGSLYNDWVIRPAVTARVTLQPFAGRVDAWTDAHADGVPLVLCGGEAYELRYYLRARAEIIRSADTGRFLDSLRSPDSPDGEPVRALLPRKWLVELEKRGCKVEVILATGESESIKEPMVLAAVKRAPTGSAGASGGGSGAP